VHFCRGGGADFRIGMNGTQGLLVERHTHYDRVAIFTTDLCAVVNLLNLSF
jgi:hypothetical protein